MRPSWVLMLLLGIAVAAGCYRDKQRDKWAAREIARLEARPRGPVVVITDYETGQPVAGAQVSARVVLLDRTRVAVLDVLTDETGRARLPAEPENINYIMVRADGYARRISAISVEPGTNGKSDIVRIAIARSPRCARDGRMGGLQLDAPVWADLWLGRSARAFGGAASRARSGGTPKPRRRGTRSGRSRTTHRSA